MLTPIQHLTVLQKSECGRPHCPEPPSASVHFRLFPPPLPPLNADVINRQPPSVDHNSIEHTTVGNSTNIFSPADVYGTRTRGLRTRTWDMRTETCSTRTRVPFLWDSDLKVGDSTTSLLAIDIIRESNNRYDVTNLRFGHGFIDKYLSFHT
jgi:hypothetical protein